MAAPIDARDFAALMAACGLQAADGPVAVAVSGGADSMALTVLAAGWGQAVALTVDHGLRPGSADEACQVAGWLQARGIDHHTLTWRGDKPASGVQAAARQARYGALEGWCRDHGVGTLLLAHHREDQAETFLLRLLRVRNVSGKRTRICSRAQPRQLDCPKQCVPHYDIGAQAGPRLPL